MALTSPCFAHHFSRSAQLQICRSNPVLKNAVKGIDFLEIHGQSLQPVSDLDGHGPAVDAAALLEVGELGDFHAVGPDFLAHAPSAQGGGLPAVLHEADVAIFGTEAQGPQGIQIDVLDVIGRGLDQDLILAVVLVAVGIFAIAPICGPAAGLHIGHWGSGPMALKKVWGLMVPAPFSMS